MSKVRNRFLKNGLKKLHLRQNLGSKKNLKTNLINCTPIQVYWKKFEYEYKQNGKQNLFIIPSLTSNILIRLLQAFSLGMFLQMM